MKHWWLGVCLTLFFLGVLAACSTAPLLGEVRLSDSALRPSGRGETVTISYRIGQPARVTIAVEGSGARYLLRENETRLPSSDPYMLRFDGTVPTNDPLLLRRVLPSGAYEIVVEATDQAGQSARSALPLQIVSADEPPPLIEDLLAFPNAISPNADGIDDVSEITYRLPVTATVDVTITRPEGGAPLPFVTADEQEPTLHRLIWNGRTVDGVLLPDGVYTYTIRAQDLYGNVVQQVGQISVLGGGQPLATITYSYMAPQSLMLGDVLTVTIRVKNTGTVPIRTYGPPSGYEYSTDEVFSSVADGQYVAKPGGFWRIGMDWDANSGGAAKRYPYRWAITPRPPEAWAVPFVEDWFLPGEEATIIGRVRITQPETRMSFYVGLIQDGVGFFQDKTGRTIIEVGF